MVAKQNNVKRHAHVDNKNNENDLKRDAIDFIAKFLLSDKDPAIK